MNCPVLNKPAVGFFEDGKMSGPKISAIEMKRLHLFEEERRKLLQDLVRLKEELKRRKKDIANLSIMLVPFYAFEEAKEYGKVLGELEQSVEESFPKIEAALMDGTNVHMKEVLQQLRAKHDLDDGILIEKEEQIYAMREKWLDTKKVKTEVAHTPSVSMETAEGEVKRIHALLDDLSERATECCMNPVELKKAKEKLAELEADTKRDGFSLFSEVHYLDLMIVRPLRARIEKEEKKLDALDERLSRELAKYHMLCQEAEIEPLKFPFAESSVEAIRYECGKLLSKRTKDADLISLMKTVRDSLEELGYTYIGEREEEMNFFRELYQINTDTVLHVIYDSMGKVTMEVAAFDSKDRPPHQREVDRLMKEQEKFCTDYEKIFHLINSRGLLMKKEAMYPPSPDFAQVINTSEFDRSKAKRKKVADDFYMDRKAKYLQMKPL